MKIISPIMILTLVVFSLATSVGWAQTKLTPDSCSGLKSQVAEKEKKVKALHGKCTGSGTPKSTEKDGKPSVNIFCDQEGEEDGLLAELKAQLQQCLDDKNDKKTQCKTLYDERKKLIEEGFDRTAQTVAKTCFKADAENEAEIMSAVALASSGSQVPTKKACKLGTGIKTTNQKEREDGKKELETLEKDSRKSAEDIMKRQKNNQEELERINEERRKLKEEWEASQEEAEDTQTKALNKMRDNQMQIAENIRKLKSSAITARQNVESAKIELKAALSNTKPAGEDKIFINLRSEKSIQDYCKYKAKQSIGSGKSNNAATGASRAGTAKDVYNSCIELQHDHRENISQSFTNALEQRLNQQTEINEQLDSASKQYSQSVEDYNKLLEKIQGRLTKAQQKYYEKDNDLANRYNEALKRGQQEYSNMTMNGMKDNMRMLGLITSNGDLQKQDALRILDQANRVSEIEDTAIGELKCSEFGGKRLLEGIKDDEMKTYRETVEGEDANQ